MLKSTLSLAASLVLAALAEAADVTAWRSRSIYQVMVDRFARSNGSEAECDDLSKFCGGTWTGLRNKLDYIQDMGFTAIQISPIVKNIELESIVGESYHGYWPLDNYAINDRFGSAEELHDLITDVHNRGMLIMVDVVVNHMAAPLPDNTRLPPDIDYSLFKPLNDRRYFHDYCNVTQWENVTDYQQCWLYPLGVALADIRTEDADVVGLMSTWIRGLVSNYSIDGLRIDAAKHVDDVFLSRFVEAAGVFALAEVLTGAIEDLCRYQANKLVPGMPNYQEYYPLNRALTGGSFADVERSRDEGADSCPDPLALGTFIENHDMPRFASQNQDVALAKNAMTYVIMNDGIPTVYQGQEQHFTGGVTPANREGLWQSGYKTGSELYKLAKTLNAVRNHAIGLSADYVNTKSKTELAQVNHLCLSKGSRGSKTVFCVTNESSEGPQYEMLVAGFSPSDTVVEVLTCTTTTANGLGQVTLFADRGEPKVWITQSALDGSSLCNESSEAAEMAGADDVVTDTATVVAITRAAALGAMVLWAFGLLV